MEKAFQYALRHAIIATLAIGIMFLIAGTATMLGLAYPESRDLAIAQNQNLPVQNATVTRSIRTNSSLNDVTKYRVAFEWNDNTARTNPAYTQDEAESMVGTTIQIRESASGRAVPVDYERSLYSTLGWIFMGAFGGGGILALFMSFVLSRVHKSIIERAKPKQHFQL